MSHGNIEVYRHELRFRETFGYTDEGCVLPDRDRLKSIADDFKIKFKRRRLYKNSVFLAFSYHVDKLIEEDLRHITDAKIAFQRAAINGSKFLQDLEVIFRSRPLYSLWSKLDVMPDDKKRQLAEIFDIECLVYQTQIFIALNLDFLAGLPSPPARRKKSLALRKWVKGHLDFWAYELRRPVKILKDHRDGYSECHMFVRRLLAEIDPDSVSKLALMVEEYVEQHRGDTSSR